ncbi:MAG: hypothetical protein ABIC95_06065 [archaeon]
MEQCKCKNCGQTFCTEAQSRINNPVCASCLMKEKRLAKAPGLPKDFAKVMNQLRKDFGTCPECSEPLVPLLSFKHNGVTYCQNCYKRLLEEESRREGEKSAIQPGLLEVPEAANHAT